MEPGNTCEMRVTGINFTASSLAIVVTSTTSTFCYRIDHNTFINSAATSVFVQVGGNGPGLIDHNTFKGGGASEDIHNFGTGAGNNNGWTDNLSPGGSQMVFIEDNTFDNFSTTVVNSGLEAYYGARTVARHNTLIYTQLDEHGTSGSTTNASARWYEFYDNFFESNSQNQCCYITLRGGTGVVWGNTNDGTSTHTPYQLEVTEDSSSGTSPRQWQVGSGIGGVTDGHNSCPAPTGYTTNSAPLQIWGNQSNWSTMSNQNTATIAANRDYFFTTSATQPSPIFWEEESTDNCSTTYAYTPYTDPHPLDINGVTLSPGSENFGSINVGSSSSAITFTLTNGSSTTATSITPTVTGGNSGDFAVTNSGAGSCAAAGASLAANASCTFTVTFTPGASGSRSTTLSVSYSGGDGASPQTSALSGTGNATGSVSVSPTSQSCGSSIVGIATTCGTFTLSNTTAVTVTSIVVTFVGTNGSDFSMPGGTCSGSLSASSTCTIIVTFTPGAAGSRSGTLNIADSGASSPQQATLTGTGSSGTATLTPSSENFGSMNAGFWGAPSTFTLTNTTATSVTSIVVTMTGGNTADFVNTGTGTCTSTLAASSSCTILVKFSPTAVGSRSTTLNVADSASSSPQHAALSGTGTPVTPAPSMFPF
jgi:hypothetical protein